MYVAAGVSFSADAASRQIAKKFGVQQPACDTWQSGVEVHAAEPVAASQFNQQLYAAEDVDEGEQSTIHAVAGAWGGWEGDVTTSPKPTAYYSLCHDVATYNWSG
jgi:hypothetical protein